MKIFTYILMALALGLIVYNTTLLDFSQIMEGESKVALISILAASCALLLMLILRVSLKIARKKRV